MTATNTPSDRNPTPINKSSPAWPSLRRIHAITGLVALAARSAIRINSTGDWWEAGQDAAGSNPPAAVRRMTPARTPASAAHWRFSQPE